MANIVFIYGGIKMKKERIINFILTLIMTIAVIITSTGCSLFSKQVKNIMWKASKGANTVYLVGTIHIAPKGYRLVSNKLNSIISGTDGIAVETDITDQEKMNNIYKENQSKAKLEKGNIEDYLSSEEIKKLKILLSDYKINYEDVKNDSPFGIFTNIETSAAMSAGLNQPGVDSVLQNIYKKSGKEIYELEGYNPITIDKVYTFNTLKQYLNEYHQGDSKKMIDTYKNEFQVYADGGSNYYKNPDESDYYKSPDESESFINIGDNYNILLKDRNINMAKKIDGLASSGKKYLVAVGAAHFVAGDSIINYLEQMGYKVEAIPNL